MHINFEISGFDYSLTVERQGSHRHIVMKVTPHRKEDLRLQTGEVFSFWERENILFYLHVIDGGPSSEFQKDSSDDDSEPWIGDLCYHSKFKSDDGVFDEPSKIVCTVGIPSSEFDELLDNLKNERGPTVISVYREYDWREVLGEELPIQIQGDFPLTSQFWSNKEHESIPIHKICFLYQNNDDTDEEKDYEFEEPPSEEKRIELLLKEIDKKLTPINEIKQLLNYINYYFVVSIVIIFLTITMYF